MTSTSFGPAYAELYDVMYRSKDYEAEAALLEETFAKYGSAPSKSVLDLGCGTGNHALALAARGFRVTAVDRSADMLRHARSKPQRGGPPVEWIESDIREVNAGRRFDAVILMFAVLSYLTENDDLLRALRAFRQHLRPSGLLAFDVWYGPAVLAQRPERRTAEIPTDDGPVRRSVTPTLDERHQRCEIVYTLEHDDKTSAEERHDVRFFFPMELELLLNVTGFELLSLTAFPSLTQPADETTWNAFCVARTV
jgi:SAM-dependent methyltransferase